MVEKIVRLPIGDESPIARLLYGVDVHEGLRSLPASSVHVVITSPPYWGLRSYLSTDSPEKASEIGGEETVEAFVENLVEVFRDLRRVLRRDGTVWLNLGDSYAGGGRAGKNPEYWQKHTSFGKADPIVRAGGFGLPSAIPDGLKAKDMVGVPWRVAFALQKDGWYLRSACPWIRRNVMPESCTDRPSSSVEYLFLLAHPESGGHYYYDIHGSRVPAAQQSRRDVTNGVTRQRRATDWFFESLDHVQAGGQALLQNEIGDPMAFVVNTMSYQGAHFAVFPPKLVEPCVLSSTSAKGACPSCGAQWVRVIEHTPMEFKPSSRQASRRAMDVGSAATVLHGTMVSPPAHRTTGWAPGCSCGLEAVGRPVVLDVFSGSATTGMVALQHGCDYVGLDLNVEYLPLAEARILSNPPPDVKDDVVEDGSVLDLFNGAE